MTAQSPGSTRVFRDRRDAGRVLGGLLRHYRDRPGVVVLALPRGGVPVAYEVSAALNAPLDVFLVRKLGVPAHSELAMGAIASGGVVVVNDDVVRGLGIQPQTLQQVAAQEGRELARRERAYREGRPPPEIAGRTVILLDDGLATGSSMLAAIHAVRQFGPAAVVVAVPAAPESTSQELQALVSEMVCATTPSPFFAVGESYWDFTQTTDEEVRQLLRERWEAGPRPAPVAERPDLAILRSDVPPRPARAAHDAFLELVGDARFVLLGEASHGTHEFYAERASLTQRLIEEKGFCAVAVEADWPDTYGVNRFLHGGDHMSYREFVDRVAERADLDRGQAEAASQVVLAALGERLSEKEAMDLASQLARELKPMLLNVPGHGRPISAGDFVRLVAEREPVTEPAARLHTQAVLSTVREAVDRGELADILAELWGDPEYDELWAEPSPPAGSRAGNERRRKPAAG